MRSINYVSPKRQDHLDGRRERQRHVDAYLRQSRPLRPARSTTRWCPVRQTYVEVR
jgi:hypothetical protein